jgi:predicted dehydrogenase
VPPVDAKALRLGIIGCGAIAQRMYATTLPRVTEVRTTHVCDTDPEAARVLARRLGARAAGVDELCEHSDAIIIATPPSSHRDLIARCLRSRRIVVCEKPFVGKAADARDLVAQASRLGSPLHVAHFRRVFPSVRLTRSLIASGAFGAVQRIDVDEGMRFDWDARSNYVSRDPMGGVLFDTGSHSVDMALFAAGLDAESLSIDVRRVKRDRREPAHELDAEFSLQAGARPIEVRLHLSRYGALANRIRFGFERGTLELSVALRDAVRLSGPAGSVIVSSAEPRASLFDCFVAQWRSIFRDPLGNPFEARLFVGLTGILEALDA